jgi:hypothetical protein
MEAHFMAGEFCLLLPRLISILTIENLSNQLTSIKKLFLQTIREETALPLLSYFANHSAFREKWIEKIQEFSSFDYMKSKLEHHNHTTTITNKTSSSGQGKAKELCQFYHSSFGDLIHFFVMKLLDYFPTISFSNSNTLTMSGKTSGASSPMPGSSSPVPNSGNLRSVSPFPGATSANNSVFNSPNGSFFQQDPSKDKAQINLILSYFHRLCELFTRQITDEDEGMIYVQLHKSVQFLNSDNPTVVSTHQELIKVLLQEIMLFGDKVSCIASIRQRCYGVATRYLMKIKEKHENWWNITLKELNVKSFEH